MSKISITFFVTAALLLAHHHGHAFTKEPSSWARDRCGGSVLYNINSQEAPATNTNRASSSHSGSGNYHYEGLGDASRHYHKNKEQAASQSRLFASSLPYDPAKERENSFPPTLESIKRLPSDVSRLWYKHLPQPVRFFLSGRCGDVCFFFCEKFMARIFSAAMLATFSIQPEAVGDFLMTSSDTITFLGGYFLHVIPQHWIHAALVYGMDTIDTREKYWTTLKGMYAGLLTAALGSTALNTLLLQTFGLTKTTAFVLTLWIFSIINYFWIGWIVKQTSARNEEPAKAQVTAPC